MRVNGLIELFDLKIINRAEGLEREITGGYTSDLLSDVMGNAESGMVWITIQTHKNVVAVASLKDFTAVVLANGSTLAPEVFKAAFKEGVTVLSSEMSAFELSGRIYHELQK